MKICPDCGKESMDELEFCTDCGTLLEDLHDPPRLKAMDNLRYGFHLATSNLKIYYPFLLGIAAAIIMMIGFALTGLLMYVIDSTEVAIGGVMLITVIVSIGYLYIVIIAIPFMFHYFQSAVNREELNIRESFKYARGRFVDYLVSLVMVFLIFVGITGGFYYLTPIDYSGLETVDAYEAFSDNMFWSMVPSLVVGMPLLMFYSLALIIMTLETVSIIPAMKETFKYVRKRWKGLVLIFVVEFVFGGIIMLIPLIGALGVVLVNVVTYLAIIDNYQFYQIEEIAGIAKGDPPEKI